MISGHTMRVTLRYDTVALSLVCHEAPGADCKQRCPQGCEIIGHDHEHPLIPTPHCTLATYLNAAGMDDYYGEQGTEILLYDGMPVTLAWDGDSYLWRPAHHHEPALAPRGMSTLEKLQTEITGLGETAKHLPGWSQADALRARSKAAVVGLLAGQYADERALRGGLSNERHSLR